MKTTVNTNQTHGKKLSKGSALVTLATTAALSASMFFASPIFGQQQQKKPVEQKPTTSKQVSTGKNSTTTKFLTQEQIDSVNIVQNKQKIIKEINKFRVANNSSPVVYDGKLETIAQDYANYCAANNHKGHTDKTGRTFGDRMDEYKCRGDAKENLYYSSTPTPPETIVYGRSKHDSGHRKNMVYLNGEKIGIGIAQFVDGTYIYVMIINDR